MKTILFFILIMLSVSVIAQDYVITLKGDTLRGEVRILNYGNIDHIEANTLKGRNHFTAIQIKALSIEKEIYNTVRTENGYRMMKLVTSGFLSQYNGRQPNGYIYDTPYLVKRDGSSIELPNLSFKKVMSNFLSDCKDFKERILKDEFSKKDIDKIVREYNSCLDLQTKSANINSSAALDDPKILALNSLKSKIESSSITSKNDALDVLKDITVKVSSNQTIPNYLTESFRGFFKEAPELQPDVEKVLAMIKK